ncbi:hypothetical protein QVD17_24418 [Tagetes erecta]|uniref:Uncharacterized protein n=1 Tax=Tagetes erecta TaxID=13708 RepID=A0AAD8NUV3_TARER|nr:hypothetical protein QVD17_24418 [Tagetes erecta]
MENLDYNPSAHLDSCIMHLPIHMNCYLFTVYGCVIQMSIEAHSHTSDEDVLVIEMIEDDVPLVILSDSKEEPTEDTLGDTAETLVVIGEGHSDESVITGGNQESSERAPTPSSPPHYRFGARIIIEPRKRVRQPPRKRLASQERGKAHVTDDVSEEGLTRAQA